MPSPTERTLKKLRADGWPAVQVVERWNSYARVRVDLFGVIDVLAAGGDRPPATAGGILGVQACAGGSHAARRTKALAEPRLRAWLEAGGRFEVWSWAERRSTAVIKSTGKRSRAKVWVCRVEPLNLADLPAPAAAPVSPP